MLERRAPPHTVSYRDIVHAEVAPLIFPHGSSRSSMRSRVNHLQEGLAPSTCCGNLWRGGLSVVVREDAIRLSTCRSRIVPRSSVRSEG